MNIAQFLRTCFFMEHRQWLLLYFIFLNPFLDTTPISYSLKTPENLPFSDVFRGYKMGTLGRNELNRYYDSSILKLCCFCLCIWNFKIPSSFCIFPVFWSFSFFRRFIQWYIFLAWLLLNFTDMSLVSVSITWCTFSKIFLFLKMLIAMRATPAMSCAFS